MARKLTPKQRLFVEHYNANGGNGTDAARKAGYKGSDSVLAGVAYDNIRKPHIAALISKRVEEAAMNADEVLQRLAKIARGFDPTKYLISDRVTVSIKGGTKTYPVERIDLERLAKDGFGDLIKTVRNTRDGPVYEFHDQYAALRDLGRHHSLFTDKVDHTSGGEKIVVTIGGDE